MKKLIYIFALLLSLTVTAQNVQFALVQDYHNVGSFYQFSLVIVPDFTQSSPQPDVSDAAFTLFVPPGVLDINTSITTNETGTTSWTITEYSNSALGNIGNDVYFFQRSPGQSSHNIDQTMPYPTVTWDMIGTPTSGIMELAANGDARLSAFGTALNSFYNASLDNNVTTPDLYNGITTTAPTHLSQYDFSVLSTPNTELQNISMYPNPAYNDFAVKGLDASTTILVHDMNGKSVLTQDNYTGDSINVSQLQAGVYFVQISNENGSATKKLIIE